MDGRGKTRTPWIAKAEFAFLLIVQVAMLIGIVVFLASSAVSAHPGRTAADGCHNDRKNGGRHCHRAPSSSKPTRTPSGEVYYPNCAAARAAGAAPVQRGQPGYGRHLDRDNDGIGCER
ncbi:excalibur calcium-binding domain-containing protein [Erythrobacter sp. KY5]|uniref:excalibur calcium-binding domain-containing protein n=1 Tax=Erythrobacter sp. KY5 TaxID=2011159 RepID=UPI0018F88F95